MRVHLRRVQGRCSLLVRAHPIAPATSSMTSSRSRSVVNSSSSWRECAAQGIALGPLYTDEPNPCRQWHLVPRAGPSRSHLDRPALQHGERLPLQRPLGRGPQRPRAWGSCQRRRWRSAHEVDALHVATAADNALDAEAGRRTHCLRCTTAPRPGPEARPCRPRLRTLPQHWHRDQQVRDTVTL